LWAVKDTIGDGSVVPGAGAVKVAVAEALAKCKTSLKGRTQLGVQAHDSQGSCPELWF